MPSFVLLSKCYCFTLLLLLFFLYFVFFRVRNEIYLHACSQFFFHRLTTNIYYVICCCWSRLRFSNFLIFNSIAWVYVVATILAISCCNLPFLSNLLLFVKALKYSHHLWEIGLKYSILYNFALRKKKNSALHGFHWVDFRFFFIVSFVLRYFASQPRTRIVLFS